MVKLHFVMIPLMAPGHIIPMIDMAKLFAKRGSVHVTIIVTSLNAARFSSVINRASANGLPICLHPIRFPCQESGLPPGCESFDALPSYDLVKNFFDAISMLQHPVEELLTGQLNPFPNCLFSDKYIPWTAETCNNLGIPRIVFDGMNCFTQLVVHNLYVSRIHETVPPTEAFVVPGLPDEIEFTKLQLPGMLNPGRGDWTDLREQVRKTESQAYGVVVNSFEELEGKYIDGYKNLKGGKVWCIGPLSLYSDDDSDRAERGNNQAGNNSDQCLKWMDGRDLGTVIYACLGSLCRISPAQFVELALGLEDSNHPFILVVKGGSNSGEIEQWISDNGIEERTKGRGLFIRGWAPQVLILSHGSVGAFLTHCGWNSTLEGICAGVPMVTWPMFAEQFLNEKLVVQILETGVRVGAEAVVHLMEVENKEVKVSRVGIAAAVRRAMDGGEEGRQPRRRARELGARAKAAVKDGGSSWRNIGGMIEEIEQLAISG